VAADGARVALLAGEHCDAVAVRDVLAGRELGRWPIGGEGPSHYPGVGDWPLQLAGDRVAWTVTEARVTQVVIADAATGVVRREALPEGVGGFTLAGDGTLAYRRATHVGTTGDWAGELVLRAPDGTQRTLVSWGMADPSYAPVAYSGDHLVARRSQRADRQRHRPGVDELVDLAPDGTVRTLLRARPWALDDGGAPPGQELLGVDVEDGRIAWALRSCDEADIGAAAIADLPGDGLDATAPEHCRRPVVERTTLRLDLRARTTVAVRCPAACSGTLTRPSPRAPPAARTPSTSSRSGRSRCPRGVTGSGC
jgi:hypothetical protein